MILSNGMVVLVDDSDIEELVKYHWHYDGRYARTYLKNKAIRMHKILLGKLPKDKMVDHINQNSLDNRRRNLRVVNKSQNMHNRGLQRNNKSGYKGVHLLKRTGRWQSYLKLDGKRFHFGYYSTAEEAAHIYNQVAMQLVGEYVELNNV